MVVVVEVGEEDHRAGMEARPPLAGARSTLTTVAMCVTREAITPTTVQQNLVVVAAAEVVIVDAGHRLVQDLATEDAEATAEAPAPEGTAIVHQSDAVLHVKEATIRE